MVVTDNERKRGATNPLRLAAAAFGMVLLLLASGSELLLAIQRDGIHEYLGNHSRLMLVNLTSSTPGPAIEKLRNRLSSRQIVRQVTYLHGPITTCTLAHALLAYKAAPNGAPLSIVAAMNRLAGIHSYGEILLVTWVGWGDDDPFFLHPNADHSRWDGSPENASGVQFAADLSEKNDPVQLDLTVELSALMMILAGALSLFLGGGRAQLQLAVLAMPRHGRERYLEEWTAELDGMANRSRIERGRWLVSLMLIAIPKMAIASRLPRWLGR